MNSPWLSHRSLAARQCLCHRHVRPSQCRRGRRSETVHLSQTRVLAAPDLPTPAVERDSKEAWQRLQLLTRQQELAVTEENYQLAAQLRDELRAHMNSLPPVQQYLYRHVATLRSGQLPDKLQAIKAMIDAGDDVVIPELARCLHNKDLADIAFEAMWSLFIRHPNPAINGLMADGIQYMASPSTVEKALAVFNDMIRLAPTFPEGYNKRATVLYQLKRFEDSIADCKTVLRMQPWHFGAASGMGLCYLNLSREREAVESFELALAIHPGMTDIARVCQQLKKRLPKSPSSGAGSPAEFQTPSQGGNSEGGGSSAP